jgi:PhzF family phenazine biosynthesis protein
MAHVATTSITVVDAFTTTAFRGNPAAVCLLDAPADVRWMQSVAAELNLSETAFAVLRPDGDTDLRWFTPAVEVDLCGHATLATTHVLGRGATFHTRGGLLRCTVPEPGRVEMDFPAATPTEVSVPAGLATALGTAVLSVHEGGADLLVELGSVEEVRGLTPDLGALGRLPHRGIVVTAAGGADGVDCTSRWFGPAVGVAEDPVTGSAHCALAPFWSVRTGRTTLRGHQASARGGVVDMRLELDGPHGDRVHLGGGAVTVWRGELLVAPPPGPPGQ